MGGIDVLVNNAGTSFARGLDDLTDEDWQGQWDPARHGADAADARGGAADGAARRRADRQRLLERRQARPSLTNAAYSVTKAAQLSLSRVFADAYASDGVLVNAVAPGAVASELWTGADGLAAQVAAERAASRRRRWRGRRRRSHSDAWPSRARSLT